MKILRIISSVNPKGGGPIEGITQTNRVLVEMGHTTEVVCVDDPQAPWVAKAPFKVHALGSVAANKYGFSTKLAPWLRANAAEYDGIVVNGIWQFPSLAAWHTLKPMAIPYIVYTHGMLDPWFKNRYPLKHLKKCLYWPWAEYRVLRDAAAVCFTCEEERRLARNSFQPYKVNEVVVSYGTSKPDGDADEQRELFLSQFPQTRGNRVLLFISRIHAKKGCDLLLDAFAQVAAHDPALHLVMAGPDQTGWREALEQQANRLGIADRITWTGMLSGDLKWGAFHAAEAFVLPSHQENFGIVVAEAMACGLPVLISNKVNIWREIEDSRAGLVASDDLPGTLHLLQSWLAIPAPEKQAMRTRAEQCFDEQFEIGRAAKSLLAVLNDAANMH